MAILAFQKPDKVVMLEANDKFGKFEFRPLEPGFGVTIGNSLRRILYSSLEGYAINTIKIAGVEHEFSSVSGVKEDVTNMILNLKQVRFKQVVEEFENKKVSITVENTTVFRAGDTVSLGGLLKHDAELALKNPVGVLGFLLLCQHDSILRLLAATVIAMLSRREVSPGQNFVRSEDGFTKTAGNFRFRSNILCHISEIIVFFTLEYYTRRRLGGRQPLWGSGVTSTISMTSIPAP